MTVSLDDTLIDVWTSLLRSGNRALDHIETALAKEGLPPLGWYDALLEVEKAGPGGLRPFELQTRLLLPQYGMSRLLKKIETAGYIYKIPCTSDRRGYSIAITGKGADMRARMWPIYARCLAEIWQDRFSMEEISELKVLLDRIAR